MSNILIYLTLGFLPLSVNFILAPLYTRVFVPSEYALLGLAGVFLNFFSIFVALGLQGAASRFYFHYNTNRLNLLTLNSTITWAVIIISLIVGLLLHYFGDTVFRLFISNIEFTYSKYGFWILITSVFSVLNSIMLSYYRNEENVLLFAIVSLTFFLISLAGNLLGVFYFDKGVYGSIVGRSIGGAIASLPFVYSFLKQGKFMFRINFLKPLFKYAFPLIPYGILMMLYESIDKILLERLFGLEELGSYTLAYQVAAIASVFIFAMFNATSPKINKLLNERNIDRSSISKITNGFLLGSLGFIVTFIAVSGPLIRLFIDESYHQIIQYLPILILGYVGRALYLIFSLILLFYHRNHSLNYITAGSIILGVIVAYTLFEEIGILAIYMAVLTIKVSQSIFAFLYIKMYNDFKIDSLGLKKTLGLAIVLLFATLYSISMTNSNSLRVLDLLPMGIFLIFLLFQRKYLKTLFKSFISK